MENWIEGLGGEKRKVLYGCSRTRKLLMSVGFLNIELEKAVIQYVCFVDLYPKVLLEPPAGGEAKAGHRIQKGH